MQQQWKRSAAWTGAWAGATFALSLIGVLALAQPSTKEVSPLSTSDVVQRMIAMNAERTADLQAYTAIRNYHLEYHGLGSETADMKVQVAYQTPGPKLFTVISESGSGMLRHHVLEPLLQGERDEAVIENREGSAFVPDNYVFEMVDFPRAGGQESYILAVTPLKDRPRFLFRGKIWVNPVDFGIERAVGHSVESPSWWVSRFDFEYGSQKIGDFWLPAGNHCISHIRLFGHAVLDITYQDFELTSIRPVSLLAAAGTPK